MKIISTFAGYRAEDAAAIAAIYQESDYARRRGGDWLVTRREGKGLEIVQGIDPRRLAHNREAIAVVRF